MWSAPSGGSETVYRARTFWCLSSRAGSMPAGGTPTFVFFFYLVQIFFLLSPRLDFSFYNVVIPELCFLFYNNRGHYTGLILVCMPFSVFERNFVFYSMQRRSPKSKSTAILTIRYTFCWSSILNLSFRR